MTKRIAFECYADRDLVEFLRTEAGLALRPHHSSGQGEVVNSVLVYRRCELGIVDEDPGATHHRERDKARLVQATGNVELRSKKDRHLILVKPDLERCFLRAVKSVGLPSGLPQDFSELHGTLNVDRSPKHDVFRRELAALFEESRRRKTASFLTELVDLLTPLV